MSKFPRLLGSASLVVAFATATSPAQAASTVTFPAGVTPVTTVEITEPGPSSPPVTPAKADPDGDGIANTWLINGKAAPAPAAPKAASVAGVVTLTLGKPGKKAKKVRVYRATGSEKYKLVATVSPKAKKLTDKKVKPGRKYRYKSVAVNAKGQQGAASKPATVKVKKAPKGSRKK